jgi:hypothetical protein
MIDLTFESTDSLSTSSKQQNAMVDLTSESIHTRRAKGSEPNINTAYGQYMKTGSYICNEIVAASGGIKIGTMNQILEHRLITKSKLPNNKASKTWAKVFPNDL